MASRGSIGDASAGGLGHGIPLELKHVFDLSLDLMCITDEAGRFRVVSASAGKILGYSAAELIGRAFVDFVHPQDIEATLLAHRSLVGGASLVEFENRYIRKDGALVALSWSSSWSPAARLGYSVARDITERKRTEAQRALQHETLQSSLLRLELAQSIARLGYWEREIESGRVHTYGEANAILGLPDGCRLDLGTFVQRVVEEDRAALLETHEQARRGDSLSPLQFRVQRADGSIRHVYAERRLIHDANGNVVRVMGTLQDVTERHEADVERQRYLAQLAFLADAARKVNSLLTMGELSKVIADTARDLVDAHVAAARITAADPVRYSASHTEKYATVDPAAFLDERPPSGALDVSLATASGRRIGLIRVADKRIGRFSANDERVLVQLADLAAVGLENARLYSELEERVRRRTQELEESNRELEAFSYSVSHDLRGPLRAIAGFTGLLRDRYYETIDADGRRYLDRVLAGTERMSSLIDDLLELGRVTRVEIKREPVDLSALARAIANRLQEGAPERAATIAIEPDRKVHGDLRLMEIVLDNLLDNAWKFTAGQPLAQIRFGSRREADGAEVFFVEDNGVGFDPRYASNLFGVFQRLHAASEFPGTGVGLATVQRIVQRHGGRIWAEAEAGTGRGATFYFTIAKG